MRDTPDNIDNRLIFTTLKKLQDGVAEIRNGQTDLRGEMRDLRKDVRDLQINTARSFDALNASTATVLGLLGELVKGQGYNSDRFAHIETRLSKLEQRAAEQDRHPLV